MVDDKIAKIWPASAVRARSGGLELRWIDDALLADLADLAARGVHDPDEMPFNVPWTRGSALDVARSVMAFQWAARSRVGAERLVLELAVLCDGELVGVQSAAGTQWSMLREVETGSWLGRAHHGRGIGRRMRALMLFLCFDGLDARTVTSAAFVDNAASNAVSRATGYEFDGLQSVVRDGAAATQNRYRMTRERWAVVREANGALLGGDVELTGLEALRAQLDGA